MVPLPRYAASSAVISIGPERMLGIAPTMSAPGGKVVATDISGNKVPKSHNTGEYSRLSRLTRFSGVDAKVKSESMVEIFVGFTRR